MGISLPLYLDWGNPIRDIEIKKRYAYLVNWKRRNFTITHKDSIVVLTP